MHKIGEDFAETMNIEDSREYLSLIKQRVEYYQEENKLMKETLKKLKISLEGNQQQPMSELLVKLDKLLEPAKSDTVHLRTNQLLSKEKNMQCKKYLGKLNICISHYSRLNEGLNSQINFFKRELEELKQTLDCTLKVDFQAVDNLQKKAKRYELELHKLEEKNPWLKNPDYNMPALANKIETLKSLKSEKERLIKELAVYQNLKPDLTEAKRQLEEVKEQWQAANQTLSA